MTQARAEDNWVEEVAVEVAVAEVVVVEAAEAAEAAVVVEAAEAAVVDGAAEEEAAVEDMPSVAIVGEVEPSQADLEAQEMLQIITVPGTKLRRGPTNLFMYITDQMMSTLNIIHKSIKKNTSMDMVGTFTPMKATTMKKMERVVE